jgi:LacI family transcriptional regulator
MAIGAMHAVLEVGLRILEDIAFVGFDDLPMAAAAPCPLTTIRQPISEFGSRAVEALIDLIENGTKPPRHIQMETELIIRASCGALL